MPSNSTRAKPPFLWFDSDSGEMVFARMHVVIQAADVSPDQMVARCDEFYVCAALVAAIQDDSPSLAAKLRESLAHLLPNLCGDGRLLGLNYHPLLDFEHHIVSCKPSEWYGWQYHAALKTVREIKAKAGNSQAGYAPVKLRKKLGGISDETLRRYAKDANVNRPKRGQGKTFRYNRDDAQRIAQKIVDSKTDRCIKEACHRFLDTIKRPPAKQN